MSRAKAARPLSHQRRTPAKEFVMRKMLPFLVSMLLLMSALGSTALAAPTFVRGIIEKIDGKPLTVDGKPLTVDGKPVTVSDDTTVRIHGEDRKIDVLAIGQNVTARIEGDTAGRVEVHTK
jgi:hypothetical protein